MPSTLACARLEPIDTEETRSEQAGKEAADQHRLLEGEDPATPHPEEATHWVDVYTELLTFKERTLSTAERNIARMAEPEARKDIEKTDLTVLEAERDRLRKRLDFWLRRRHELTNK